MQPYLVLAAVQAVAPSAIGLLVGEATDRTTWRVDYGAGATAAEITAGNAAMLGYQEPTSATGAQLSAALDDLGSRAAFETALAAAKPTDRLYWSGSYREGIPATSPKLRRLLGAASIDPVTLFAKAAAE